MREKGKLWKLSSCSQTVGGISKVERNARDELLLASTWPIGDSRGVPRARISRGDPALGRIAPQSRYHARARAELARLMPPR